MPASPHDGPATARLHRLAARLLRPHRFIVLLCGVGLLAQALLVLPVPLVQGRALDRVLAHRHAEPSAHGDATAIVVALVIAAVCLLGRSALAWAAAATMNRVSLEIVRELTDALHRKLQRLPLAYFDRAQTGALLARITGDVGSLMLFLNSGSLQLAADLILAVGVAGVLLWLHWPLALAALTIVPLTATIHRLFAARLRELAQRARAELEAVYAHLCERVSAVRVVRSFAQEGAELKRFADQLAAHREAGWAGAKTAATNAALSTFAGSVGVAAVLAGGAALIGTGRLTVGELLAFLALAALLYGPVVRLAQFQGTLAATRVAAARIAEVLEEPEPLADRPGAVPVLRPRGALEFRTVTFRYRPDGPPVLDRVSFTVEPGTTVGLLGPSGAGKSTLLALAPRLYEVEEGHGAVLLDGRDVRELRLADLRRAVALVPQQAILFEGTIRSNLLYAAPKASPAAVRSVLEALDLAALVDSLPQGPDTPVGERGYSLSGGQRQRLALARALLADPAVVLLDDCTSALDAETVVRVRAGLDELLPGRTCVVVAHKTEAISGADRVIVLKGGRIVEAGARDGQRHSNDLSVDRAGIEPAT